MQPTCGCCKVNITNYCAHAAFVCWRNAAPPHQLFLASLSLCNSARATVSLFKVLDPNLLTATCYVAQKPAWQSIARQKLCSVFNCITVPATRYVIQHIYAMCIRQRQDYHMSSHCILASSSNTLLDESIGAERLGIINVFIVHEWHSWAVTCNPLSCGHKADVFS